MNVNPLQVAVNGDVSTRKTKPGSVAIVIATHKQCYPLDRCIKNHVNLLGAAKDLVFVDNGSGGELTDWAKKNFPNITIITREKNGYFCGGYNSGMQYAIKNRYEYVLIVNADTDVVNVNYIFDLMMVAKKRKEIAFVGPMVYIGAIGNIQNTVLLYPWFFRYMLNWFISPFVSFNRSKNMSRSTDIEFLNSVCVLMRVSALKEIGLFDEIMGGYVEDADLSLRGKRLGWRSTYTPVPSIIHHQDKDEYEHYSMKSFMLRRNHVYWHMKEGRPIQAFMFAFTSLVLATIRAVYSSVKNQRKKENWKYVQHFFIASKNILIKKPMGDWFGPPFSKF